MSFETVKHKILERASISEVIGEHVALKNSAGKLVGLCPFHPEKSPSFYVYDDNYYCFGCKASGDVIEFVRKTKDFNFIDALKHLGQKYSVDTSDLEKTNRSYESIERITRLFKMMTLSQSFFVANLQKQANQKSKHALDHLKNRGFTSENILEYGFGCSGEHSWDLSKLLRTQGFSEEEQVALSLAGISQESGRPYDFFIDRITVPIADSQGRLIAFGGRTFVDHPAKYKNSRNTELFEKSSCLFNLHRARESIREDQNAVIVEGYMDALQLSAHGIKNTVACLGTALTLKHLQTLKPMTSSITLLFDGDSAGQTASFETLDIAMQVPTIHVRMAALPQGLDPDEYVKQFGVAPLREEILDKSVDLFEFAIRSRLENTHGSQAIDHIHKVFVPWLVSLSDPLRQSFFALKISEWSGVSHDVLTRMIKKPSGTVVSHWVESVKHHPNQNTNPMIHLEPLKPLDLISSELLGFVFSAEINQNLEPELKSIAMTHFLSDDLISFQWRSFMQNCLHLRSSGKTPRLETKANFPDAVHPTISTFYDEILRKKEAFSAVSVEDGLLKIKKKYRKMEISQSIQSLKKVFQKDPQNVLLREITSLTQELDKLNI